MSRHERFWGRLARHLGALAQLAWPVMLSRAGILLLGLADVVMLGRYSTQALGEASVSLGLFVPIMVTGVGLQTGLIALVSRRHGAGEPGQAVEVWLRALPWAVLSGSVGMGLMALGEVWLGLLGQSPALAEGGGAFSRAVAPGVLFQVLYIACAFFLEGTGRPKAALVAMVLANLLNVFLNWVLIYGNLGMPALGAVGSGLGTSGVRAFMALALFLYILRLPDVRAAGGLSRFTGLWGPGGWAAGAEMRRLGYAAGLSLFFETSAFGALMQMAGWLGPVALAAYSIAQNIESTVFMVALGLSVATAVRVGMAVGAKTQGEARFAGFSGLAAALLLMALIGGTLVLLAPQVTAAYTADAGVAAAAAGLMGMVALAVVPDGGQIVVGQCNRAMGDAWVSSLLYLVSYWGVMIPLGWVMAFRLGLGPTGLLAATATGSVLAVVLLALRFAALTARRA